jgi:streptogramin lyase
VYSLDIGPDGSLLGIGGGMRGEPPSDVFRLLTFSGRSGGHWVIDGLPPVDWPSGVVATPDGVIWIAAVRPGWGNVGLELGDGVLLRFENGTFSPVLPLGEDRQAGVSGIAVGPEGTLAALLHTAVGPNATEPSLARLAEEGWETYPSDGGLPDDLGRTVGTLAIDADGRVWTITGESGAPYGIAGFDGEDWSRHLQGTRISDLAIGPAGSVWAAASDGIYVVRPVAAAR